MTSIFGKIKNNTKKLIQSKAKNKIMVVAPLWVT
jgi:hypothetical protein